MKNFSVVIATFNEEKNIKRCLENVKSIADEIILIDAQSSDRTIEIAKTFKAKIFIVENDRMFHKNKQLGLEKANGKWILQLDADEVVSDALRQEITRLLSPEQSDGGQVKTLKQTRNLVSGYYIPRKNYFLGRWMTKGGLYPDKVIRLVKNNRAHFPCKSVHEQIIVDGQVGSLNNPLLHFSNPDISTYLRKANRYTSLYADELKTQGIKPSIINSFKYCLIFPIQTFINIFILNKGFLDGLPGFIWAFLSASHHFISYGKLVTKDRQ